MLGMKKTYPMPDFKWVQANVPDLTYTPDVLHLENRNEHLLFICDDMMQRHTRHDNLKDAAYQFIAFTESDEFSMWMRQIGTESFPIPFKDYFWTEKQTVEQKHQGDYGNITRISLMDLNATQTGHIKGELYKVSPERLYELDKYRQNGVQFIRQRVKLLVPYRYCEGDGVTINDEEFVVEIKAFMYVGVLDFWEELLNNSLTSSRPMFTRVHDFISKRRFSERTKFNNYYFYTVKEANAFADIVSNPSMSPKKDYFIENAKETKILLENGQENNRTSRKMP